MDAYKVNIAAYNDILLIYKLPQRERERVQYIIYVKRNLKKLKEEYQVIILSGFIPFILTKTLKTESFNFSWPVTTEN